MQKNNLSYATPESVGIPSQAVKAFVDELRSLTIPVHSVMLMRHGKVVAEGYCPPFDENRKHRMYSVSKSFTSVGIGMLIDEGKITLDTKIADMFPEYLPENPNPFVMQATVRDYLRMASFNEGDTYDWDSPDFVEAIFTNGRPIHKPGDVFHYDTSCTVALCAIIEKISGKSFIEYMRPLFDKLGISNDIWCIESPEGRCWTGSGILATPRDLMRFGQFCLNRGMWNGEQLVSREYMTEATTRQIDVTVADNFTEGTVGYGYQFWIHRDGGFGCHGMGGQFAFMMPKTDSVVVLTGDNQGMSGADEAIRHAYLRLIDAMQDAPLAENKTAQDALEKTLHEIAIPLPYGEATSPAMKQYTGKTYEFEDNIFGFKWMRVDMDEDKAVLTYENRTGEHTFPLFMGRYEGFLFPEKYFGTRIGTFDREYKCISAAAWTLPNTLLAIVYAVDDYVGRLKMQFTFSDGNMTVFMTKAAEAFFDDYRGYLVGHEKL